MASKGLRTASVSTVTEVDAGDKALHTTETLICYTVCCALVVNHLVIFHPIFQSFCQYQYVLLSMEAKI